METIKTFIIVVLAAGFFGTILAFANLWRIIIQARKDFEAAEVDGTFTDEEYIILGKNLVSAIKECRTILDFIRNVASNLGYVTIKSRIRIVNNIYKINNNK